MNTVKKSIILLLVGTSLWMPGNGLTAEIRGETFADTLQVGDVTLSLQGVSVLKWARLFDVYAGAFYLPSGRQGSDWADNVAKHLELAYFRDIEGEDFGRSSDKLLQRNLSPASYRALQERLQSFYQLFRDVRSGDRYSLTYRPGIGTELRLNGERLGSVPGHDFAVAYFGLWLGKDPISASFRDALLGASARQEG